jgi:hypothetical protein
LSGSSLNYRGGKGNIIHPSAMATTKNEKKEKIPYRILSLSSSLVVTAKTIDTQSEKTKTADR